MIFSNVTNTHFRAWVVCHVTAIIQLSYRISKSHCITSSVAGCGSTPKWKSWVQIALFSMLLFSYKLHYTMTMTYQNKVQHMAENQRDGQTSYLQMWFTGDQNFSEISPCQLSPALSVQHEDPRPPIKAQAMAIRPCEGNLGPNNKVKIKISQVC